MILILGRRRKFPVIRACMNPRGGTDYVLVFEKNGDVIPLGHYPSELAAQQMHDNASFWLGVAGNSETSALFNPSAYYLPTHGGKSPLPRLCDYLWNLEPYRLALRWAYAKQHEGAFLFSRAELEVPDSVCWRVTMRTA